MRITQSQDGVPRFTLKLELRIGVGCMAVHLINRFRYRDGMGAMTMNETREQYDSRIENQLKATMSELSEKEILETVRESVLLDGTENPHYIVSDQGYSAAVEFLKGYLARKYKKFADGEVKP